MTEHTPGQWAVFRSGRNIGFDMFGAAQIERVTTKTVYAKVNYGSQFSYDQVIPMPDEATAKLLVEQIKSAIAEANECTRKARQAGHDQIAAILAKARGQS